MEILLFVAIAIVGVFLIVKARSFGQNNIWGPLADKMNKKTLKELDEFIKEEEKKKKQEKKENKSS
jgi:hypothetical protein